MDCKLAYMAAGLALITPFMPSSLTGVDGWQKVGVCAAATLFYGVVRYFNQLEPIRAKDLKEVKAQLEAIKSKLSTHSIKLGMGKYEG